MFSLAGDGGWDEMAGPSRPRQVGDYYGRGNGNGDGDWDFFGDGYGGRFCEPVPCQLYFDLEH